MNRRSLLAGAAALGATALSPDIAAAQGPLPGIANKPNIIFISMDNLGYGEPVVYGGGITRGAPTPRAISSSTAISAIPPVAPSTPNGLRRCASFWGRWWPG